MKATWWMHIVTQELMVTKIVSSKNLRITDIVSDTPCPPKTKYFKFVLNLSFVFYLIQYNKKKQRINKLQCQVQSIIEQKITTRYLIFQLAYLKMFYQPYCMEENRGYGVYHCATRNA